MGPAIIRTPRPNDRDEVSKSTIREMGLRNASETAFNLASVDYKKRLATTEGI
ncbi:hypothetical protein KIN20_033028 [Parelaphostrongylus tenuis]|uniref:Uncharacterized protein n=1 Tax=Parelaphostrongylus tenuis TaxID=148309 RepID=A0AAD5R7M1_PARTN|nr:hypothetical protein KIN20_033028 [Parelaphostrongylus tenuis]